jgi:hypothetical protein
VYSSRRGSRSIEHLGSARDDGTWRRSGPRRGSDWRPGRVDLGLDQAVRTNLIKVRSQSDGQSSRIFLLPSLGGTPSIAAWSAYGTSSGLDHSGWAGIIEANEQVTFAPLSCDRYPPAGHPLPDLPPHRGVPARQPQRGPDRALPPGPSRSARRPFPIALRRLPALGTVTSADCPRTPLHELGRRAPVVTECGYPS